MGDDVKYRAWTRAELKRLRELAAPKTLFMKEIAEIMGLPASRVLHKMRTLGINYRSKRLGTWNAKHAHTRKAAFTYFLSHTWEETRLHFDLTQSELKSLFTVGYRLPELAHLRKDRRRRDAWTLKEQLFFLRRAGLRDRKWIAGKLKRGGHHAIKDNLKDRLHGLWSKQTHGLPNKLVRARWGILDAPTVQTDAGPISAEHSYRYIIVPWVILAERERELPQEIRPAVRAMARFQKWIYGTQTTRQTLNRMRKAVAGTL